MSMRSIVCVLIGALWLAGCASGPITTWPYSSWYSQSGNDSMASFNARRAECLSSVGANLEPSRVPKGSGQENNFIICMNEGDWCTQAYNCDKSGAS